MLLPITSTIKGLIVSTASERPATEKMSFPAAATGLAPKTGEAIKVAPFSPRLFETDAQVSGWTVEVSTNILPANGPPAVMAFVNNSYRTSSLEI